jgi:hypothetical protein
MATVFRTRKGETTSDFDQAGEEVETPVLTRDLFGAEVEKCSICGDPYAAAWWMGHERISVCRPCAVGTLPLLIADAVVGEHGDSPNVVANVYRTLDEIKAAFWRGVAIATHRGAKLAAREAKRKEAESQPCACRNGRARPGR